MNSFCANSLNIHSQNIVITPGALFSVTDRFNSCLRLSFSHPMLGARENAIKMLGVMLRG